MDETNLKLKRDLTFKQENNILYIRVSSHQDWFDVLVTNEVDKAESILSSLSPDQQRQIINTPFSFELLKSESKLTKIEAIYLPFHFAIAFNSRNVAQLLIDQGVEITGVDMYGCNVLHACVVMSFYMPDLEKEICETVKWLLSKISSQQLEKLFVQENVDGHRPIEFASQQGCLQLMNTFFQTKAYIKKVEGYGISELQFYDVTEYEYGERFHLSPLTTMAFVDKKRLENKDTSDIILSPLFVLWMNAKIKANAIPLFLWLLLRYGMLCVYFIVDNDSSWFYSFSPNQTIADQLICPELAHIRIRSDNTKLVLIIIMIVYFGLSLILDVLETLSFYCAKNSKLMSDISGRKNFVTNMKFYYINQFLLSTVVVINYGIYLGGLYGLNLSNDVSLVIHLVRAVIPILILWSLSYFLQMLPVAGSSFISIQAMQNDVIKFIFMFIIIIVPFILSFQSFLMYNSKDGCVKEFSSVFDTLYTLFLLMLNAYDLTVLNVQYAVILKILHIIFIFMVGIMLLNFLIAIMSSRATAIAMNERLIYKLNQVAMVSIIEYRLFMFRKCLQSFLKFGFHCEEGKVYLKSKGSRIGQLLQKKIPATV